MDLERFFALHDDLPREAPGSDACTQDALARLKPYLPADPRVLDIGCGPGRQTMVLARVTGGHVDALDIYPPYLQRLRRAIAQAGLDFRVKAHEASMFDLSDFPEGAYDLIWSEGAIFIIGFADGLRRWKKWLKPGGLIGVTECTWLTDAPPTEARDFWADNHPDMATEAVNRAKAESKGYRVIETFTLPASAWWNDYYVPLMERVCRFRKEHGNDPEWTELLDATETEIEMHRRHGSSYGYVFYLMQRAD